MNKYLFIIFFFLTTLFAQEPIQIDTSASIDRFDTYMYEDKSSSLTINNIKDFKKVTNKRVLGILKMDKETI